MCMEEHSSWCPLSLLLFFNFSFLCSTTQMKPGLHILASTYTNLLLETVRPALKLSDLNISHILDKRHVVSHFSESMLTDFSKPTSAAMWRAVLSILSTAYVYDTNMYITDIHFMITPLVQLLVQCRPGQALLIHKACSQFFVLSELYCVALSGLSEWSFKLSHRVYA